MYLVDVVVLIETLWNVKFLWPARGAFPYPY